MEQPKPATGDLEDGGSSTIAMGRTSPAKLFAELAEQEAILDEALKDEAFAFLSKLDQMKKKPKARSKEKGSGSGSGSSQASTPRGIPSSRTPDKAEEALHAQGDTDVTSKLKEVSILDSGKGKGNLGSASSTESDASKSAPEQRISRCLETDDVVDILPCIVQKVRQVLAICKKDNEHLFVENQVVLSEIKEWRKQKEAFGSLIGLAGVDKEIHKLQRTLHWSIKLIKEISSWKFDIEAKCAELEGKADELKSRCKEVDCDKDPNLDEQLLVKLLEMVKISNKFITAYKGIIDGMFHEISSFLW